MDIKPKSVHSTVAKVDVAELLNKYRKGSCKEYELFLSQLSNPSIESHVLLGCLQGIRECIGELGKDFEVLVGVILKLDWCRYDRSVIKEYQLLTQNLVSAHTCYLKACLRMLVKLFLPKLEKGATEDLAEVDQATRESHNQIFSYAHKLLQQILRIVPLSPLVLLPLLSDCFPYMTKETYIQECYVRNILHISSYLAERRSAILEIVVDKMTKLDVRSPREELQQSEFSPDDSDMEEDIIFDMEDDIMDTTNSAGDFTRQTSVDGGGPMTHKEGDRLDVMMRLTFTYINDLCYKDGELDWEVSKKLYLELMGIFERIILPTHASSHVQFIMFYICSFKQPLYDGFIDFLWKKVCNPSIQPIYRQASVAYIASLVARANYISISTVKEVLNLMVRWIHMYISEASEFIQADIVHHGPFYSICQAVFYVIAFRHREVHESRKGQKFLESLNFQAIVTCRLNPLRVCLPIIVKNFSSVTRQYQLAFCDTIIERNKRCMISMAGGDSVQSSRLTQLNPLDSFFPFDPYLLSRSSRFIIPLYQEYQGSIEEVTPHTTDDEDNEDFISDVHSPSLEITSNKAKYSLSKTPTDFLMYGTSPGFKHT